jgi:hypothetical protein
MAALTNLSDIVNRCTGGNSGTPQNIFFYKDPRIGANAAAATVTGRWTSFWQYNGFAAGGAVPGAASNPDNTTVGSLLQGSPGGGRQQWLLGVTATALNAGTLYIYDRLGHRGGLSGTSTSAQTVNLSAARYTDTASAGNIIAVEIFTQIGGTSTTITASYTNQDGTDGRTTAATLFGATGFREAQRLIFLPLASGDTGVQSVQSITLAATTGTAGDFGVVLMRPILSVPLSTAGVGTARDLISGIPSVTEIKSGACLAFAWLASTSTLPQVFGSLHLIEK